MRKTIKFLSLVTFCQILNFSVFSQNSSINNLRNIEVTGSSEMSIKPDEIQMDFTIKEYYTKGAKEKFNLAAAEKEFFAILDKYGLKEKDVILDNSVYSSNWYSWWKSKKEELKYKTISIKVDSNLNLLQLVKDLDKNWLDDISISNMKNKKEQDFRKEVKIQAIKAAKEKATYLLNAIGEQIGKVISVKEIEGSNNNSLFRSSNSLSNNVITSSYGNSNEINNIALIKLRYEMKVVFEIQ